MEKNLVFISDTHGLHDRIEVPDGDILIHCGDISSRGLLNEVTKFSNWFCKLPHKHKVIIPGNHDFIFEKNNQIHKELFEDKGVTFLNDSQTEIEGIKIWGSPITPYFHNWAFNRFRGSSIEAHWNKIPEGMDIVITHGPPANIGDLGRVIEGEDVGCEDLYKTLVHRVKPKINCFGHIHEGYGIIEQDEIIFINCSILNRSYKISNEPIKVKYSEGKFTISK